MRKCTQSSLVLSSFNSLQKQSYADSVANVRASVRGHHGLRSLDVSASSSGASWLSLTSNRICWAWLTQGISVCALGHQVHSVWVLCIKPHLHALDCSFNLKKPAGRCTVYAQRGWSKIIYRSCKQRWKLFFDLEKPSVPFSAQLSVKKCSPVLIYANWYDGDVYASLLRRSCCF